MTWTEQRVARLLILRGLGLSFAEIGRSLGVSRQAVQSKLAREAAKAKRTAPVSPALRRLAQYDPLFRSLVEAA